MAISITSASSRPLATLVFSIGHFIEAPCLSELIKYLSAPIVWSSKTGHFLMKITLKLQYLRQFLF